MVVFFFSSRRRHTRCALVTGVQTCALPILVRLGWRLQPSGAYTSARIGHGIAVICCTPGVANHEHIWFRESFVNLHSAKLQPTESYRPQLKVAGKRENVMRADEDRKSTRLNSSH